MTFSHRAGNDEQVQFVVGLQEKIFYIPYERVKEHFDRTDCHGGLIIRNFENEDYTFDRARLRDILPDDFRLAKDYILNKEFGPLNVETQDQREELFALCGSAWDVAERLGMEGLLRYTIQRLKHSEPWGLLSVLGFATRIYENSGFILETHKLMGDTLSSFIAANYWQYMEEFGAIFVRRMKDLPDLVTAIQSKLASDSVTTKNCSKEVKDETAEHGNEPE